MESNGECAANVCVRQQCEMTEDWTVGAHSHPRAVPLRALHSHSNVRELRITNIDLYLSHTALNISFSSLKINSYKL